MSEFLARHSGAERSEEPGIHNHRSANMDSGLAALRRSGMTGRQISAQGGLSDSETIVDPKGRMMGFAVAQPIPHAKRRRNLKNSRTCQSFYFRLYNRNNSERFFMASKAQRKATKMHRRRAAARGLVRVEVQAAKNDAALIRALAATLREGSAQAKALRSTLAGAVAEPQIKTAFDVFGSDLPDELFEDVFAQARPRHWREIDL